MCGGRDPLAVMSKVRDKIGAMHPLGSTRLRVSRVREYTARVCADVHH